MEKDIEMAQPSKPACIVVEVELLPQSTVDLDEDLLWAATRKPTTHLDGLRGAAALLVFLQHFFCGFAIWGVNNFGFMEDGKWEHARWCALPFVRLLYTGGNSAVTIFFVLSGYVLSIGPLTKIKNGNGRIRKELAGAVVRRPFRLLIPPIVVTLLTAIIWQVPGAVHPALGPQSNLWDELKTWVHAMAYHLPPWHYHDSDALMLHYNMAIWTLPVELNGSLWVYGVMLIASFLLDESHKRATWLCGTLLVIAVGLLQAGYKWSGAAFTMGMILAVMDTWSLETYAAGKISKTMRNNIAHGLLVVGLYLLSEPTSSFKGSLETPGWGWLTEMIPDHYGKGREHDAGRGMYYRYWGCWGSFMVVYATLRSDWLQNFFNRRSLRFLGKVSFMFYLIHSPWTAIALDRWHEALGGLTELPNDPTRNEWYQDILWIPDVGPLGLNSRFLCSLIVAIPTTLALAELATRYIDQPSIRIAEKVASMVGLGRKKQRDDGAKHRVLLV